MSTGRTGRRSVITEAVAQWGDIPQLLRGGEAGTLVPVIIPRHRRRLWWMLPLWLALLSVATGVMLSVADGSTDLSDAAYEIGRAHV